MKSLNKLGNGSTAKIAGITDTTPTFSTIELKALLMDTITFLKFGHHLAPNWKGAKNRLCVMAGQKTTITAKQLLTLIGLIYKDNGAEQEANFWATIDKFAAEKYLITAE